MCIRDRLYAATYDKMGAVKDSHTSAINKKKYARSIHSLAPDADGVDTCLLYTSRCV